MNNIIVNFTPTGMIPEKKLTPFVPISIDEIVSDVRQLYSLGITMVHLHARDQITHKPTYDKAIFQAMIREIRKFAPDLIICVSTSGRDFQLFEQRAEVLELEGSDQPDMASLTLSSLNFNKQASVNSPEIIKKLAEKMQEKGIKPELEVFDLGMINYAHYLIKKGLLTPPFYFNIILGNISCAQVDLMHLGIMLRDLPDNSIISIGGVGNAQYAANALAIATGYGIRVGLEDNIWMDESRSTLATNMDLVQRTISIASAFGRKVMTPSELRKHLNLRDL